MTAPPTQMGERELPARARPVPFCRHGFLPPPLTKARVLVDAVPTRRLAWCERTASYRRCWRTGPATTAAGTSISPTRAPAAETTGSLMLSSAIALPPPAGLLAH